MSLLDMLRVMWLIRAHVPLRGGTKHLIVGDDVSIRSGAGARACG